MVVDLTDILDKNTNLPSTWKTLVREVLLKFENGITYHHDNIAGNRPYHVDLNITIDDPVDDETYEELHQKRKEAEKNILLYHLAFQELVTIIMNNELLTDELKDLLTDIGVDLEK